MGKGGRGGKKSGGAAASRQDDDALLDAAIADNHAALEKVKLEAAQAEVDKADAQAAQAAREEAIAVRDAAGTALSRHEITEKLDTIPSFCIVNASKQFVPLRMTSKAGHAEDCMPMQSGAEPAANRLSHR